MSSQPNLPRLINVKLARTPIGGWTAASADLPVFVVMSNNEHTLRALIGEQIAAACHSQGFDVDTGPVGNPDNNTVVWSITIRNAIQPTGPSKVGGTDFFEAGRKAERARYVAAPLRKVTGIKKTDSSEGETDCIALLAAFLQ